MAFDNNQSNMTLPDGNEDKKESIFHLPKYFRTPFNEKFLNATIDQLIQSGVAEKLNGFYGRKNAKAFEANDSYIKDITTQRENYQLEPVTVIKDELNNLDWYSDYEDFINKIKILNGNTNNHSFLNEQEYYSWRPHIDWDKFVNFREYYWAPTGPIPITIYGQSKEVESTYNVTIDTQDDSVVYYFRDKKLTPNPSLTLYRGQTYRFSIDVPNYPIAFATKRSFSPGESILIEAFDGLRGEGIYDIALYDSEGLAYDAGGYIIPPNDASFTEGDQVNTSLIYDTGITQFDDEGNEISTVFLEKGIIEFTVPETAPDYLYYISKTDANVAGFIKIYDILENTEINVGEEILGKKEYVAENGVKFTNGMKVNFAGSVLPIKYDTGDYYVEGVGTGIELVSENDLNLQTLFSQDVVVPFDENGFDTFPFGEALGYPSEKDYVIINRASEDRSLWSRYNRWFHKDVLIKSFEQNQMTPTLDQSKRAKRPIIEFDKGLKLYQFGVVSKENVDLLDDFTTDVFSTIEGSLGYVIDGVELSQDMRILFTADPDSFVKNKIYKVNFITINNVDQITLVETDDTSPSVNETVLVKFGNKNKGKFYYYNGEEWKLCQEKTSINQAPLFDMYDHNDINFRDETYYKNSNFVGNKLFSYSVGTGTEDSELGFPVVYRNIANVGDILFNFNLVNSNFSYLVDNVSFQKNTENGYLRKYNGNNYELVNGWKKVSNFSNQNVLRQYISNGIDNLYLIDMYDDYKFGDKLWIRVYVNNLRQTVDVDYSLTQDINKKTYIRFAKTLPADSVILIKTRTDYDKNDNGLYEIPSNLEKNPKNSNILNFTYGEVIDHVGTIVENSETFSGSFPGNCNLRDLGDVSGYGRKFLKHSAPFNLAMFHLLHPTFNIIKAIKYCQNEYAKFKRLFLETANTLGYDGPIDIHLDKIINKINIDKQAEHPFFTSDMLPTGGYVVNNEVIEDTDQIYFALSEIFDITVPSNKAVLVTINDRQLTINTDYYFNEDGFVVLKNSPNLGDIVKVVEYENTNGCFIPATPTKLGIYPKFKPEIFIDKNTRVQNDIEGNGPFKIYGSEEGDGNKDIGWFYPLYDSVEAITSNLAENENYEVIKFNGLNTPFFIPSINRIKFGNDSLLYNEYIAGEVLIQGHDGSKVKAYKDFRDKLIIEYELRIFNNLKIKYDTEMFNIHNFLPGLFRNTNIDRTDYDNSLIIDFLDWTRSVDEDYNSNIYTDLDNSFTYNYSVGSFVDSEKSVPGWWRQVYKFAFDTDRPNTHPWEMLGFSVQPDWWVDQYGSQPYTSNNLLLWNDIEQGIIRKPTYKVDIKYARPGITKFLPVNETGELLSPVEANLVKDIVERFTNKPFTFGDSGPIENAWRHSSSYPFSMMISFIANQPHKFFATGFDRVNQTRNKAGQIVYGEQGQFIQLSNILLSNTSGVVNFVLDYIKSFNENLIITYLDQLQKLNNQLGIKVGGYTEKEKFKLILDSRTPQNEGNVFVPDENYSVYYRESFFVEEAVYSGVIVEKQAEGFYIRGYDKQNPFFRYNTPITKQGDASINVGGVTESFVEWASNQTYTVGNLVRYQEGYYRCTVQHVSGNELSPDNFVFLSKLPVIGGRNALLRKDFNTFSSKLNYGDILYTIQDVVDFLLGYGDYLTKEGFIFEDFNTNTYEVSDWILAVKQFLFWTTQNWDAGTVIALSPGANKISYKSTKLTTPGNVFDTFYGYSVFQVNGQPLSAKNLKFHKKSGNQITIQVTDTAEGIYALRLPLMYKEHVILIDNRTVFNDVIYELETGYRQERIKVLGYRIDGWDGSLNVNGFFYDSAKISDWTEWTDYKNSDVVKYKEYYYAAMRKITGSASFNADDWDKLQEKPYAKLYPNFDYKINQFADFYDLESDNFDVDQQALAQHLIGYQKRNYLSNIINDDVSQYKFYQGFIREKGTRNALSKLFDALSSANKDSLEFYEEWAVRDGQYGSSAAFSEVEYILEESKFKLTPQPILLTNIIPTIKTDLIYRIQEYETYLKPKNYTHKPFPKKLVIDSVVKNSGFVHPEDVTKIVSKKDDILNLNIDDFVRNDYIWVGSDEDSWNVYQYQDTNIRIKKLYTIDVNQPIFYVSLNTTNHGLKVNDIICIENLYKIDQTIADSSQVDTVITSVIKGFFKVNSIVTNVIGIKTSKEITALVANENFGECDGNLSILKSQKAKNLAETNEISQTKLDLGDRFWVSDDGTKNWGVFEVKDKFEEVAQIFNPTINNTSFGEGNVSVDQRNTFMAVGSPKEGSGKVYIYNRPSESLPWQLSDVLFPLNGLANSDEAFGAAVSLTPDSRYLIVGSPNASNIKSRFLGNYDPFTSYAIGDIVKYSNSFWKTNIVIEPQSPAVLFSTFTNYNQLLYDLNLNTLNSEEPLWLLAGNYPFDNIQDVDHFVIRINDGVYQGIVEDDEVVLYWNTLTNANQTQTTLVERQPFNGAIPELNADFISNKHSVLCKFEAILFFTITTNEPLEGDIVNSTTGSATVVYSFRQAGSSTVYIDNIQGTFRDSDSLFKNNLDFIGEYTLVVPALSQDTTGILGGYVALKTPFTYDIVDVNSDSGRGLVVTDVIVDSTTQENIYQNMLMLETNVINSKNTENSYVQNLSSQGFPGAFDNSNPILSKFYVVRGSKALTDVVTPTLDKVGVYFNNLENINSILKVQNVQFAVKPNLVAGEKLSQLGTDFSAVVASSNVITDLTDPTFPIYLIEVSTITGSAQTISFINRLFGSISGDIDAKPVAFPEPEEIPNIADIGISYSTINQTRTVFDVWDGYIDVVLNNFSTGAVIQPFEPIARYRYDDNYGGIQDLGAGQIVRDRRTDVTGEVMFYIRDGLVGRLFIKTNFASTFWSKGSLYGETADLEMLPYPNAQNPFPDPFGRPNIYAITRVIGYIQQVSLGYPEGNIGGLLVFENDIPLPVVLSDIDGRQVKQITGAEIWVYQSVEEVGAPRAANIPSPQNLDWQETFRLEADFYGTASSFVNQGLITVYEKIGRNFVYGYTILPPVQGNNFFFGSKIETSLQNDIYRAFVSTNRTQTADLYDGIVDNNNPSGSESTYARVIIGYDGSGLINNLQVKFYVDNSPYLNLQTAEEVKQYFELKIDTNEIYYSISGINILNYIVETLTTKGVWKDGVGYYLRQFKAKTLDSYITSNRINDSWYSVYPTETDTVFFLKNGTENNNIFNWEYSKNKLFRGLFNEATTYQVEDIVFVDDNFGQLYRAITNISPGPFRENLWSLLDNAVDHVGYVPNDTGLVYNTIQDSALDKNNLYSFAKNWAIDIYGQVFVSQTKYYKQVNEIAIYRNLNGLFKLDQVIQAPTNNEHFGDQVSLNSDGTFLVISDYANSDKKILQGIVYVYKQIDGEFKLNQILNSPQNEVGELFGFKLDFDGNKLVINSRNASGSVATTFDDNTTYFDNKFTTFAFELSNSGVVYVYENVNGTYIYVDTLNYSIPDFPTYYFGHNLTVVNNHIYVTMPTMQVSTSSVGVIVDYRIANTCLQQIRAPKETVDLSKIKRIILYNKSTNQLVKYLDYIDPLQGKIVGAADANISYKLYYDPAIYTNGDATVRVNSTQAWNTKHVGKVWWDLTNVRFYYPYQNDVTFSVNVWNSSFIEGSIEIYEWVESNYLPVDWNTLADTNEGIILGISGVAKNENAYTEKRVYDKVSGNFSSKYYFWVKDKAIIPADTDRTITSLDVRKLIENPFRQGYEFIALISEDSFAVYNCEKYLDGNDLVLGIQYWDIADQRINTHNQYQILTNGLETSIPNRDIENKWIDSLVGYDINGRLVPDPTLGEKEKYGLLNFPRQSMFKNREEALKQYIERVNSVLEKNLIVDTKNLLPLQEQEAYPSSVTRIYDVALDTVAELEQYGVAKAKQGRLSLLINEGEIINVFVTDPGRGYLVPPTYTINGTGEDAEIEIEINSVGSISGVNVIKGGKNYKQNTTITVRKFTALVKTDETILGKWSLYERNTETSSWTRIRSQAYNASLYWDYIDWYADGISQNTNYKFTIDYAYELFELDDEIGDMVKVKNIGTSGWLLLEKINDLQTLDYTLNYKTIGKQNGTIKFSNKLFNLSVDLTSYDSFNFDVKFYDNIPSLETRIICNAIKNNLFIEDLAIEYNNLFFASLRYVFVEQAYVDWAFKTNFVKAKHNAGELRNDITYNNDNLPSYEEYIKEVKPFKVKVREFISSYEKTDNAALLSTDFDLQPIFNYSTKKIEPQSYKLVNNVLQGQSFNRDNTEWINAVGFDIESITVIDGGYGYQEPPIIYIISESGTGATAKANLGVGGSISNVVITNRGSGYLSNPTLRIAGSLEEDGRDAILSVKLGQSVVRSSHFIVKFDRINSTAVFNTTSYTESFIGSGSKYVFDLTWPIDLKKSKISVSVDNLELLTSEVTYENIVDYTKGYTRYLGRVITTLPPARFTSIIINYNIDVNLLSAVDRIKFLYAGNVGQIGNDLGQLLTGIDYGGVEVKSFDFGGEIGWDSFPYFTDAYDTYDTTFEDITIKCDGSTNIVELPTPLEKDVLYNLYKNGVRLDDPDWTPDSTGSSNPNAIMRSVLGDGISTQLNIQNLNLYVDVDDIIIIRKVTSDGSFIPTNINYDTMLSGGNLNYSNAKGLNAEDITIDGDGFTTIENSSGPEEVVPGTLNDTLDIKVYQRPSDGTSVINSYNFKADGQTDIFTLPIIPLLDNQLIVKVNGNIKKINDDYIIDYNNSHVEFVTPLNAGDSINILNLGYSGKNILDIATFVADGSTITFDTKVRFSNNGVSALVTTEGKELNFVILKSEENNVLLKFAEPLAVNVKIDYAIFEGSNSYSLVHIEEFVADGNTSQFNIATTITTVEPAEWFSVVKVNDRILNAGYAEYFTVTETREYNLKLYQIPVGSINNTQLRVFLNNKEIFYFTDWFFSSAEQFDPTLPLDQQVGSYITLNENVGVVGDILRVHVIALDNEDENGMPAGGEYRYGYFDEENVFVKTPDTLYIDIDINPNDVITVYRFSNDSNRIERQRYDVVARTELYSGEIVNSYSEEITVNSLIINLPFILAEDKEYAIYLNNVRVDDPNFGTGNPVTNPNALMQTLTGDNTNVLILSSLNLTLDVGVIFRIEEINGAITVNESSKNYFEYSRLKNGYVPLYTQPADDQYVWVVLNGQLLKPSLDYYVSVDKSYVKIVKQINENDSIEVIHFTGNKLQNKFGWRAFKDILNRNVYTVLDGTKNVVLSQNLNWYDKSISVINGEDLPNPIGTYPGVVFVDGERIEYFIKDGDKLKQLRRGTLGTGVKEVYLAGTEIYDQSSDKIIPYKDEVISTIFIADGSTKTYNLDFLANSVNEFEVFVAGKRLRKNEISSYQLDTDIRAQYAIDGQTIAQDSPEGDVTLPPEFTLENNNLLVLLDTPLNNQKVIVIRRQGKLWKTVGTQLAENQNEIVRTLLSTQVDLPR